MERKLNLGVRLIHDPHFNDYDACQDIVPIAKMIPLNHQYLLSFLKFDLNSVMESISEAVLAKDPLKVSEAYDKLLHCHPYFSNDPDRASAYVNHWIAKLIWEKKDDPLDQELFEKLAILHNYQTKDINEWLFSSSGKEGFGRLNKLLEAQEDLNNIVMLLLNDSNPELASIPEAVRSGLYGLLSLCEPSIPHPKASIILPYPESMKVLSATVEFEDIDQEKTPSTLYKLVQAVRALEKDSKHIPPVIKNIAEAMSDGSAIVSYIEYDTESLEEVLYLEVYLMLQDGVRFKTCESCGRLYPVAPGTDEPPLCDFPDPDGSSCRIRFLKKKYKNLLSTMYRRAYRTHYARVQAGKETEEGLDNWRKKAMLAKKRAADGDISENEFLEILR